MFAKSALWWVLPTAGLAIAIGLLANLFQYPLIHIGTGVMGGLAILFLIFFRDPEIPVGDGVIAPAAGKVTRAGIEDDKACVSIFMNVNNIHVNRAPLAGRVVKVTHRPGGYRFAFDKDSEYNERVEIVFQTAIGPITVILIAGWLARRIEPYVKEGDKVEKGQRISIIKLGSRVDTFLPAEAVRLTVQPGHRIAVGRDTIAEVVAQDREQGPGIKDRGKEVRE